MIEVQNLTKKFDGKVNKSYLFAVKNERKKERTSVLSGLYPARRACVETEAGRAPTT